MKASIDYENRLTRLRAWMKEERLRVVLVSSSDEFLSEYAPPYAQRLKWLTGFTGSMGEALVTTDQAFLFVDGRYVEHARREVPSQFQVVHTADQTQGRWLSENLKVEDKVGVYGWTLSVERGIVFKELIMNMGATLAFLENHPVDLFWDDRPPAPRGAVVIHPLIFAGKSFEEKVATFKETMVQKKIDTYVLVNANAICWLLNLRGEDHSETPIFYSYLLLHAQGPSALFTADRPGLDDVRAHLKGLVDIYPLDCFMEHLKGISKNQKVAFDGLETPAAIANALTVEGHHTLRVDDLTAMPRARKNPMEVAGARKCHIADGLALVRTFCWLEHRVSEGIYTTEHDIALKMIEERSKDQLFRMPSFATIAGFGPNSSVMHYRAPEEGSQVLTNQGFLLIDSGGQYLNGTTDVTRTFAFGDISEDHKQTYTRVLKGHIQLAKAIFPIGTKGWQLDVLARGPLWQAGLDYAHGTGHGVGSYLSVHENPMYIGGSSRFQYPFEVGMVCSNEPGYYVAGEYGIRIESLMTVVHSPAAQGMLSFEIITRAPISLIPVVRGMLLEEEVAWINDYHAQVWKDLSPLISTEESDVKVWLEKSCKAIV